MFSALSSCQIFPSPLNKRIRQTANNGFSLLHLAMLCTLLTSVPNQLFEAYFFVKLGLNCSLKHIMQGYDEKYLVVFSSTIIFQLGYMPTQCNQACFHCTWELFFRGFFVPQANISFISPTIYWFQLRLGLLHVYYKLLHLIIFYATILSYSLENKSLKGHLHSLLYIKFKGNLLYM